MNPSYRVLFERSAWDQLVSLPEVSQLRILSAVEKLEQAPRPAGCEKLSGAIGLYRIRAGDYRVIYQVLDAEVTVLVVKVGHRREVYR